MGSLVRPSATISQGYMNLMLIFSEYSYFQVYKNFSMYPMMCLHPYFHKWLKLLNIHIRQISLFTYSSVHNIDCINELLITNHKVIFLSQPEVWTWADVY